MSGEDSLIRMLAFAWLKKQVDIHGDILTRSLLQDGFIHNNIRYTLVGPKGIWKPRNMQFPISITSIVDGPYPDKIDEKSGILNYRYQGTNINHPDNIGLREAMQRNFPLIYFHNIAENKYLPMWPVYIVGDNPTALTFTVMADDVSYLQESYTEGKVSDPANLYLRRAYITSTRMIRVHQKGFREKVLQAYRNQCTLCRLKHPELLDAAHIIADSEDIGDPIIQNGLSLCKIHHAAYDKYIIGINPDYQVIVRQDILEEIDGPMLKFGIQSINKSKIILPRHSNDWPDRERLDRRFEEFRKAV